MARRGDTDITIQAPKAKDGYRFVGWYRYAIKTFDDDYTIYGYEAIYEEIQKVEETSEPEAIISDEVLLEKNALEEVAAISEESIEANNSEITKTENPLVVENDLDLEKTVYADYPEAIIWWAEFKCNMNMCEGFDGHGTDGKVSTVLEGRRGDIESLTMKAPKAKAGYKFAGWSEYSVEYNGVTIRGYEAVYVVA